MSKKSFSSLDDLFYKKKSVSSSDDYGEIVPLHRDFKRAMLYPRRTIAEENRKSASRTSGMDYVRKMKEGRKTLGLKKTPGLYGGKRRTRKNRSKRRRR